ncbi:MAG: hypothetical protein QOK11_959 [Pseudonocardiales bacterium]|nr:hypothetical protein [Pseudonocardiales bacterium]
MAQRKSPPSTSAKSGASKAGAVRPRAGAPGARPPVKKKPGKSIVNQKQTPWGLIVTTIVIVAFAVGIVTFAVVGHKAKPAANGGCTKMIGSNSTTYLNELQCAKDIQGVTFTPEASRNHVATTVKYDATPPVGGNHSPYWADCAGTVYANAIANENAVHMLEHGAVWITYKPGLAAADVATLSALVNGKDYMAMSPYPNLSSPISLQSWGYELKVDSASDPRISKFIEALRFNPKTTPEYGATCSQPTFKAHPSTFGSPLSQPVSASATP